MGGCATKPKVFKDAAAAAAAAAGEAPMPVPEKEEVAEDVAAEKDEAAKEEGGVGAEDEANRRRSLSNLFKEGKEKSVEHVENETSETKKASELSESNPVVDAPTKVEAENAQEVASTIEITKVEIMPEEEKTEDNIKPATEEGNKDETPEIRTEEKTVEDVEKSEIPVEEKTEEKPIVDAQTPEKSREKKTEEAPATPQIEEKKPPSAQEKKMEN